ncbi:MAG TPA: TlyA family RNA methyltransferase [Acidimicrobiales bacterium]|nr:TlyA family RNA methyltransferase [Acidimicrobiales bacterium]
MSARRRLDDELVRRKLARSRTQAQADIAEGRVLVGGAPAAKPARLVHPGDAIVVTGEPPRFVSRAGAKLDAALDRFGIEVAGRRCLDAGASTGGFCDCLLQRGAAQVVAVDVGRGQLHERIAADPRVHVLDRTNVRDLDLASIGEPVDVVTADLSFISLRLVVDALLAAVRADGDLVLLVKPQFEAGREVVSKGRGIVTDPEVWREVLLEVTSAIGARGATIMGAMASPVTGSDGNVEFVLHVRPSRAAARSADDLVAEAVGEAVRVHPGKGR